MGGCSTLADTPIPILCEDFVRVVVVPELQPIVSRTGALVVRHDDLVVIQNADGDFVGRVTRFTSPVVRPPKRPPAKILRFAVDEEVLRSESQMEQAAEIERYVRRKARELELEMRPIRAMLPLSGNRMLLFFTAEQRVDFRPLLQDLSRRYRMKVDMRPLGVRDGARLTGGLGPCGRGLCCATFMNRFHSVTVRMAKRQRLSLNPAKISGMCGRLMCCLAHEVEQYPELKKKGKQDNRQS